jgi:hypothetical protein
MKLFKSVLIIDLPNFGGGGLVPHPCPILSLVIEELLIIFKLGLSL